MKVNSLKLGFLVGYTILFITALMVLCENGYTLDKSPSQAICPVMDAPIDESLYVDHNGKRIYVCCGACISAVRRNPEKYIKELQDSGVQLESVPES